MKCPVSVEEKGNASWADDATQRTSHTKHAFSPEHYNDGESVYIGIPAGNWKQGLYNYRHSFSNLRLKKPDHSI